MNDRDYEYTEENLNVLRPIDISDYSTYDDEDLLIIDRILE